MSETGIVEITHRKIAQMLTYFNTLPRAGIIACFCLEHLRKAVDYHFAYRADKHKPDNKRKGCAVNFVLKHGAYCKKRSRYFHCTEYCIKNTEYNRNIEFVSVFPAAKIKEFLQHCKHQTTSFPEISSSFAIR